jgi:hypothetical protein
VPNDGDDYGPDSPGTVTSGIQEALNGIATTGGYVFCRRGTYVITSSIVQTGNNQTVFFEPGCVISFGAGASLLTDPSVQGYSFVIHVAGGGTASNMQNFSNCFWYGNGCTIQQNGLSGPNTTNTLHIANWGLDDSASAPLPSLNIVVDNFVINGVSNTSFYIGVGNFQSGVTYARQMANVRVSRITATWSSSDTGASGFCLQGSARQVLLEDLDLNASAVPSGVDYSNCFARANAGDCTQIVIRRSRFKNNGSSGQVLELQGNSSAINPSQSRSLHDVLLEDCVFDSGASSGSPFGGSGGGYIDDNNGTSGVGFVYNIEFRHCQFVFAGINFQSAGTQFGYLRFTDDSQPGAFSGS